MEFTCSQCPRKCGARRADDIGGGICRAPALPRIARAALHFYEEPPISGTRGSGTVFFSGCPLGCVYCQNYKISHENFGKTVTTARFGEILAALARAGAHNINLVNPTHYAHLLPFVKEHSHGLPVIYNTGGYERAETLASLEGCVDIYLTDIKYRSPRLSKKLSGAADYFDHAVRAAFEMFRQVGSARYDRDGIMTRGVIVRHLVLPGYAADSLRVLEYCRDNLPNEIVYSIMSQYTPMGQASQFPPLSRRVRAAEYARVRSFAQRAGFAGFVQELSSAAEEYVPPFDLEGV